MSAVALSVGPQAARAIRTIEELGRGDVAFAGGKGANRCERRVLLSAARRTSGG